MSDDIMVGSDDRIVGTEFSAALSSVILPMLSTIASVAARCVMG